MWDFQSRFGGTYSGILLYLGLTVIFPLDCIKITLFAPKYLSLLYFTYLNVTLERNHVTYKTVIKLIFMHRWCVNDQVKLIQPSVYYHALEFTVLLKYLIISSLPIKLPSNRRLDGRVIYSRRYLKNSITCYYIFIFSH